MGKKKKEKEHLQALRYFWELGRSEAKTDTLKPTTTQQSTVAELLRGPKDLKKMLKDQEKRRERGIREIIKRRKTFEEFVYEAREWNRRPQRASKGRIQDKGSSYEIPKHIMMTGAPGSGKSTLAKEIARKTGGTRYGYDDARREIHGDHTVQGKFPEVHALTMKKLRDASRDNPRIQDNTNVNKKYRPSALEKLKKEADFEEPITSIMPPTKRRGAFRRNRARGEKQVPRHIMKAMWNQHDEFRKTKEGKEAIRNARKISKQLRISLKGRRTRRP